MFVDKLDRLGMARIQFSCYRFRLSLLNVFPLCIWEAILA